MSVKSLASGWIKRGESPLPLTIVLKIVDHLRKPIQAAGVDFKRFRSILELKLRLDLRATTQAGGGSLAISFGVLLGFGWLAGLPVGVMACFHPDPVLWMAAVQATNMGLLAFVLLLQYGPMLVDSTDIAIVAPLPVGDRTLFAARMAHVLVYTGLLWVSIAFWPMVLGSLNFSAWAVLTLVPLASILSTFLTVGLVSAFYGLVLILFGPVRFQRLALWLQVGLAAFLMGGSQLLPRIFSVHSITTMLEAHPLVRMLVPPMHFGGLFGLALGDASRTNLGLTLLALLLPMAACLLALYLASRHFIVGLSGEAHGRVVNKPTWKTGILSASRLGRLVTRSQAERSAFDLTLAMSRRDRVFLRFALPQLIGFSVMIVAVSVPFREGGVRESGPFGVFALYMATIGFTGFLDTSRYTEFPKASGVLHVHPVLDPGFLLAGGVKGLLLGVLLPVALVLATILLVIDGVPRTADIVLALEMVSLLLLAGIPHFGLAIPFTCQHQQGEVNVRMLGLSIVMTICAGAAAGVHALARLHPVAQGSLMVLVLPVIVVLFRRISRLTADLPRQ